MEQFLKPTYVVQHGQAYLQKMIQKNQRRIQLLLACAALAALHHWTPTPDKNPDALESVQAYQITQQPTHSVTIVSALYDIGRTDRVFQDYLDWMKITFQIRYPLVMFCQPSLLMHVRMARKGMRVITRVIPEPRFPLQETSDTVKSILHELRYNLRQGPEWNFEQYIPLQFAKFTWISRAVHMNPFSTPYFYWIDTGLGRFFQGGQMALPRLHVFDLLLPDRVSIQLALRENGTSKATLVGNQYSPFLGGIFGGGAQPMLTLSALATQFYHRELLGRRRMDNEQVCIAKLYGRHRHLFQLLTKQHFPPGHCNVACI